MDFLLIALLTALNGAFAMSELAITDHVDFERGAPAYRYATFEQRERTVREAADRWAWAMIIPSIRRGQMSSTT